MTVILLRAVALLLLVATVSSQQREFNACMHAFISCMHAGVYLCVTSDVT